VFCGGGWLPGIEEVFCGGGWLPGIEEVFCGGGWLPGIEEDSPWILSVFSRFPLYFRFIDLMNY